MNTDIGGFLTQLILGLVQGFTEIFPVSSSGHLALTKEFLKTLFGFGSLRFEGVIFLHLGTFLAIWLFYQKDVWRLWRSLVASLLQQFIQFSKEGNPYSHELGRQTPFLFAFNLFVTAVLAIALKGPAEKLFDKPLLVAALLIGNGCIVFAVGRFSSGNRKISELNALDYLFIGIAQGIAVLPGVSRFGFTLCAGLIRRMNWFEALRLSFLLSLPTVLAASCWELTQYDFSTISQLANAYSLVGIPVAFISSYFAIRVLLREALHARTKLSYFGLYCIVAGLFSHLFISYLA